MTEIDYSKVEINISKVIINVIISVYFYGLGIVLIINYNRTFFGKHSFHDTLYPFIFLVLLCVISACIYNIYRRKKIISLFMFWFFALISFFIKGETGFVLSILSCFIYAVYSLSLLAIYDRKYKDFIKKYNNMINFKKFNAYFTAVFLLLILYYLFLIMYEYYTFYQYIKPLKRDSVYIVHLFIPLVIFFFVMIISAVFLFNSRYVFMLCPLSEYKQVPLSAVTFLFNSGILDEIYMRKWFNDKIGIYMNGVSLDVENSMIVFNKYNLTENNKQEFIEFFNYSNEKAVYSLNEAIKKLDELMELVVYKGTNLKNILYSMKECLEKIKKLHINKSSYDKYIENINSKYIPNVEYLVKTYLKNIDLNDEAYADVQKKIVYTLEELANMMYTIYKSKTELVKFNLDVELDTIDLLIRQKGYYKDTI